MSLDPDVAFDYLDISAFLKFDVNNSYGSGFYLKVGIRYSLVLSAKTFEGKADVKDAFKNSNFGLVGGFGSCFLYSSDAHDDFKCDDTRGCLHVIK